MVFWRALGMAALTLPALLAWTGSARAAVSDPAFTESVLLAPSGQAGTTGIAWAPDGSNRLFFARQTGRINVVNNGVLKTVVAVDPVFTDSECGVIGIAFDPRFLSNHYLYVFVTVSSSEQQIIRYTLDGDTATDKTVIVAGLPTRGRNHDAGGIGFGPDGKLYWSIGDLGNYTGVGANLSILAAKISRANLDGSAPEDNPFFDGDGPNEDRIWASGFRNPFTFTWQPGTDLLWVNVVGTSREQIFTPRAGDNAGYSEFENNQTEPFLAPILSYPTSGNGASAIAPTGAVRAGGSVTFTTSVAHGLRVGTGVNIAGAADISFNGFGFVTSTPTATTFTLEQNAPDASSGGGAVTPTDVGNAITGGTFWDSSSVPPDHRGNFFFGDYVTGRLARVALDANNRVSSFYVWGTAVDRMIDMAVGPDGDLYLATFAGGFYRIRYNATEQGIIASSLHLRVPESGEAAFSVRLAMPPTEPVSVGIERTSGDEDVQVLTEELSFDALNWATPQVVLVAAGDDEDSANDDAELTLHASGLPDEATFVRTIDDDPLALVVTPPAASLEDGASVEVSVALSGVPASALEVQLTLAEDSALEADLSAMTFGPEDWGVPQPLQLTAHITDQPLPWTETVTLSGRALAPITLEVTVLSDEQGSGGATGEAGSGLSASAGAGAARGEGGAEGSGGRPSDSGGQSTSGGGADAADSGCGCRVGARSSGTGSQGALILLLALAALRRRRGAVAAWLALASTSATARAAISDPAFTESVHLQPRGMAGTSVMAWAPDGSNRLLYARQLGQLWLVNNGALKGLIGLSPVFGGGECGLLGMAFDPNFVVNRYLYLFVTVSKTEQQIIRFTVGDTTVSDMTVVVAGLPTRGSGHNAGSIGFGPDGKLYWAIGDLANQSGTGEDLTSLAAKVSRANLDGSAPPDNPFYDGDGPNEDRIWARGFRNPFTFTWRPGTEEMWVNTVGLNHEQIFVPKAGDNAGWASYENNQPEGYLQPLLSYPKAQLPLAIAAGGASREGGVATFTTATPHGLHVGTRVTIAGSADASFDGVAYVSATPSAETFSVAQAGPDAVSGQGSAAAIDLGDCITGGAFWDSSSVPASYRGNFFFGDCTSWEIGRVTLRDGRVSSLDSWGTGTGMMIDMAVGPDGDLYYTTFQGGVYRIRYNATSQGIVVSSLHVRMAEAGRAVFSVRLAMAPSEPVTIAIERTAGDADVETEESELSFDATNWSTPQTVMLAAAEDDDGAEDVTQLTLSSLDLPDESVEVRVTDDDPPTEVVTPAEGGAGGGGAALAGSGGELAGGELPSSGAGSGGSEGEAPLPDSADSGAGGASGSEGSAQASGMAGAPGEPDASGDCACRVPRRSAPWSYSLLLLPAALLLGRRRSRRSSACARPEHGFE